MSLPELWVIVIVVRNSNISIGNIVEYFQNNRRQLLFQYYTITQKLELEKGLWFHRYAYIIELFMRCTITHQPIFCQCIYKQKVHPPKFWFCQFKRLHSQNSLRDILTIWRAQIFSKPSANIRKNMRYNMSCRSMQNELIK